MPSYAMIVRAFFPAGDADGALAVLLFAMIGMALGGWMAETLYDYRATTPSPS